LIADNYRFAEDPDSSYLFSRIAVIRFSDRAEVLIGLNDASSQVTFKQLVDVRVFYQRNGAGNTNTTS
jgi:hypothetical protein